jgi:hypothetical protein
MPKLTKHVSPLPKNLQLTFIMTAAIAFVVNAIYWILLLVRVYPHGMRISQFSIWAIGMIIFPALVFGVAYLMTKKEHSRLEDVFNASLLALTGLLVQTCVILADQFIISPRLSATSGLFANLHMLVPSLITLVLFIGFILLVKRGIKNTNKARLMRQSVAIVAVVSLVATATANVHYAFSQFATSYNVLDLLVHPAAITSPILPIIFFAIAYYTIQTNKQPLDRLFTATIYSLIGVMIAATTTLVYTIGIWTLAVFKAYPAESLFDIQTAFVVCVSLLFYAHLIITHYRSNHLLK